MPIPETLLRWFESELEPGEEVRATANADLWLRYRRLVLTDRRILAVERLNLLHPRRGRSVESTPLTAIRSHDVHRGRMVTTLRLETDAGPHVYHMLNRSLGTGRFAAAVKQALGQAAFERQPARP
jgi:head-tail adaptor